MSERRLRLAVTGLTGQVVSALIERAPKDVEIIALGRPQLELSARGAVIAALRHANCNAIINAAAYTQVDRAESEEDVALRVNGAGAGYVAEAAAQLGAPLLHLSTDYVFDGLLDRPYREDDVPNPQTAYGRSKLAGELAIQNTHEDHVILRTSWVFSPFGVNFVKTMLRLAQERAEVSVVSDQFGNPTEATDIADALVLIARRLVIDSGRELRGLFHLTGEGGAAWADVAEKIFTVREGLGRSRVNVKRILTSDYPTPAKRPKNSRLDTTKFKKTFGINLPPWQTSLESCVSRLLLEQA